MHHHPHFRERKRLQDVIAGAGFHGFDCGFDGAEGGHHNDGQGGLLALYRLQKFEAAHAGKFQVGDD